MARIRHGNCVRTATFGTLAELLRSQLLRLIGENARNEAKQASCKRVSRSDRLEQGRLRASNGRLAGGLVFDLSIGRRVAQIAP